MATKHTHRFIARFRVEAETSLFIGSGEASLLTDALVQKDVNGFPMIPGTSLAGVLRHAFGTNADELFGDSNASENANASKLKVSNGYFVLDNGVVSEGILDSVNETIVEKFNNLPKRQHVRITDKGVAKKNGLFDNEVVYKGTQFIFEIEVRGTENDKENWNKILKLVQSPTFRIGAGTRNGYGRLKVIDALSKSFDLTETEEFEGYLNYNPSFNTVSKILEKINTSNSIENNEHFIKYALNLTPDLFFIFSEGFGDDEADNKPIEEEVIVYENGKIDFKTQTLIPATSIKGAISHRVAFHYNKIIKSFASQETINSPKVAEENEAVYTLFGKAGEKVDKPMAGKVFLNDFYFSESEVYNKKIFNHVAIDRFTGGAMDGALFSEKVSMLTEGNFNFEIFVDKKAFENKDVKKAFENTLKDLCSGLLPLGGMTTKGNGMFTGSVISNEGFKYDYLENQLNKN